MARANPLTDMQLVLLTAAAGRPDGSLLPPPASLGDQTARIRLSVRSLVKRALAEEFEVADAPRAWRAEDGRQVGAVITNAGRIAIGDIAEPSTGCETAAAPDDAAELPATKRELVIGLLHRDTGASLVELASATGWLPHTTRAALTGLRKKGHVIAKDKVDGETRYHIAVAA